MKLCGLTRPEDILAANLAQPEYIGFVFAKSRRQVTKELAKELKALLSPNIQAFGVFVNAPVQEMIALVEEQIIDGIQLHGQESEDTIRLLKEKLPNITITKAVSVTAPEDVLLWQNSQADFLLLDNGKGGTGEAFNWALVPKLTKPIFLAGGLYAGNVLQAIEQVHPYAVDVSSGIETDGKKDKEKMIEIVRLVRHGTR